MGNVVAGGPNALAATKRLVNEIPAMQRDEAFSYTEQLSAELFASEEAREGIAAFREKRNAPWSP